ncbi:outer membrane beta-barrel protein [Sphingobacterium sp. DN00404]|uniref:Outer membrane beta-barrel protein n=1 Tax=Sphingobacterium micropteri TaxID=2763501 RepID=A0ABR7YKY8_9SPHI|nr:outer membrane beta-barrel protein [Sphingobacterium micropteri]MBD1431988.1 outer membrane beta-barrel protein [Sphingobacterium micropteri]
MKSFLTIICGLAGWLFAFNAVAQTGKTVQGMLRDNESRVVAGASVQLEGDMDTLGTSASPAGIFTFKNVRSETFTIKVSSLGFEPFARQFSFSPGQDKMVIPSFQLQGIANMLEEVVVDGVITVQVKGDTVEYATKDLKLREGALAEDALKRLQGVEVDKDGNVTAQGEQITRVRINGKDFFGGDVKTATQNLPANIIEKMQVIDDYGDMANLTGNRTGDSEKVLNIQIDPEYNKGQMSTVRVGYGTEERFQTTGMWMGLTDKTQVSVLGNLNNMNANLFDFNTMGGGARQRMGGGGGRGGGGAWGGSDGITKVGSIGLNVRHDFSDKLKVYGSYSFGRDDNNTQTQSFTEYIGQNMGVDSDQDNNSIRTNHRMEANVEWNISEKDYLKLTPQFGFNKNDADNLDNSIFYLDNVLDYTQVQTQLNGSNAPRYGISGLYNRRLNDKGRNFFINFNYDNAVTENDYNQILDRLIYDPNNQNQTIGEIYEQTIREAQNKSWNAGTSVSYTEPLGENSRMELTYDFNINDYDNFDRQNGFDRAGNPVANGVDAAAVLNYSYDYDYAFTSHRMGANYSYDNDKIKYSIGAAVQPTVLSGNAYNASESAVISRNNFNVIPIARFEYRFSRQSNITFNYSARASEPGVSQILPFEVSTNRTSTTIGNPNLDPEFQHSGRIRFRSGDFQKGKTFFATVNANLTNDKIVSFNKRYPVEGDGIYQEVRYLNESEPVYSVNSFYHLGRSLKDKTYNIMYMGSVNYNKNIAYIAEDPDALEGNKNVTNNTVLMQGLFFRYTPSENLEINPGARYSYNITKSSLPQYSQGNVSSFSPTLIGSVNITPTTIFGADVSKTFNKGYRATENPFIINTYIEQRMLKGQRGTIRLQAFDLLDQQININRTVGDILTDSRTNRLGRYFMLTFTFRFQKFSGMNPFQEESGPGGMRRPRM